MVHLQLLNKGDTSLLGSLSSSFSALFVVPGSNTSSRGPLVLHKWGPSTLNQGWITARLHIWLFVGGHFRTQLSLMPSVQKKLLNSVIFGTDEVWMWDLYVETSTQCKYGSHSGFYIKPPAEAHRHIIVSISSRDGDWFSSGWRSQISVPSDMSLLTFSSHAIDEQRFPELSFLDTPIYEDLIQLRGNQERTVDENRW